MHVFLVMGGTEQLRRRIVGRRFSDSGQYLISRPGRTWDGDDMMGDERREHLAFLSSDITESVREAKESGVDVVSMFAGDPDERALAVNVVRNSRKDGTVSDPEIRLFGIWISDDNRRNAPRLDEGYDVLQYDSYIPDPRDIRSDDDD